MTGYTVHTGSSLKFSDGWDKVFAKGAKKKTGASAGGKTTKASTKKSAKKRSAK